eukprot:g68057.t1
MLGAGSPKMVKILCAGLGKTGTLSLQKALRILGFDAIHYVGTFRRHGQFYLALFKGELEQPDFKRFTEDAVLDEPNCYFFREFLEAWPDCKVILSTRSDEGKWCKSYVQHVRDLAPKLLQLRLLSYVERLNRCSEWLSRRKYRAHNNAVRQEVPPGQLLEWQPEMGWKVCNNSNKPDIQERFMTDDPHTVWFMEHVERTKRQLGLLSLVSLAALVATAAILYRVGSTAVHKRKPTAPINRTPELKHKVCAIPDLFKLYYFQATLELGSESS